MNEQGGAPEVGVHHEEEPQVMVEVIDVNAYAQLLATVEGLKHVVGE